MSTKITDIKTLNEFLELSDEEKKLILCLHKEFKIAIEQHAEENESTTMIGNTTLLWLKNNFQEDTAFDSASFLEAFENYRIAVQDRCKRELSETWGLAWEDDFIQAQEDKAILNKIFGEIK